MKLKFVLVPLMVLGFAVGSYADCSKDEIMKLIDRGFTKTEIKGVCGKSEKKKSLKWVNPSRKTCVSYGGEIKNGVCKAKWLTAKDICSASNARLPTVYELKKVIVDCGGIIDDYDRNKENTSYQSCYKVKGFIAFSGYWSSISFASDSSSAWIVAFGNGNVARTSKTNEFSVRCVRGG